MESVAHILYEAPQGCFSKLYDDIKPYYTTIHDLPQNKDTFFDMCKSHYMGYDASFYNTSTKLTITTMSLVILNNMLKVAGYDQIDIEEDEDEDDRGLNFNIL